MTTYRFPDGFVWGAATSAYQIEGSPLADGAGMSIQHTYAHTPGNVEDGGTGDVAADHYHRWRDDIALMRDLGLQAYQFSIAWPRVLPEGIGEINKPGLDFYDSLVDGLLEAGVAPVPILHVWDVPTALQDRGGWVNRESAEWFAEFAALAYDLVGDRATHWLTICEPLSIGHGGHIGGVLAPSIKDLYAGLRATHHVLLGHGRAVEAFRASGATGLIGTSTQLTDIEPASDSDADRAAAARANAYYNEQFFDPIMKGEYPQSMVEAYGEAWPPVADGDLRTISAPVDFLGVTMYAGSVVAANPPPPSDGSARVRSHDSLGFYEVPWTGPLTGLGYPIQPEAITSALRWLRDRYDNPPVIVAENGASFPDTVTKDGTSGEDRVDDVDRVAYIRDNLIAAHRAIDEGVDLRGWFVWSLLDTWEFWLGYQAKYGIVHIDYETQRRIVKSSGYWYRDVMAANGFDA